MQSNTVNILSAWLNLGAGEAERRVVDAIGLPERGLAALVLIDSHPGCSVDWLYRRLGITQSGTVRLLDRLQSSELITRHRPGGQREVEITISAAGCSVLARGVAARASAMQQLLSPLSEQERDHLIALIARSLSEQSRERRCADTLCRLCDWSACTEKCPVDASVCQSG